jgi:O-acetyl-ADP-ribose deacetylase (regulator of RNase III)
VFNTLRQNYKNLKIFSNLKNGQNIRVTGKSEEAEKAFLEIDQFFCKISNSIVLKDLELKESEFKFLIKQNDSVERISSETHSIINVNGYKKYVSLKFPQSQIELDLYEGDLTNFTNVDAYVNPVNVYLHHNDGIAKALIDKAGLTVKRECDQQIKKYGNLQEGDVFTTKSGEMGAKINSFIIHSAGPIWKGGLSSEDSTLFGLVKKCLNEAKKKNCSSILIPPISTGIFNFPIKDAVEVISRSVIEYINENCLTSLKKIIFISNEEEVVKSWELVLLYLANIHNIKIEKRAQKVQISNDTWFWKDDEGNEIFKLF